MIDEEEILVKLRAKPGRGGVRLSHAEADWLAGRIENPVLTPRLLRQIIDQVKRYKILYEGGLGDRGAGVRVRPGFILNGEITQEMKDRVARELAACAV